MVLPDRNHPSVIMWSLGNEIRNTGSQEVLATADLMIEFIGQYNPTRPVTMVESDDQDEFANKLEVAGMNYFRNVEDETVHKRNPGRIIYASESFPWRLLISGWMWWTGPGK